MRILSDFLSLLLNASKQAHLDYFDTNAFYFYISCFCVCVWVLINRLDVEQKKCMPKKTNRKEEQKNASRPHSVHYLNHELKVVASCHTKRCDKMKNPIFAKFVVFFSVCATFSRANAYMRFHSIIFRPPLCVYCSVKVYEFLKMRKVNIEN